MCNVEHSEQHIKLNGPLNHAMRISNCVHEQLNCKLDT